MIKPKLAEGSRLEDGCVCNAFGEVVCIDENRNVAINVYHRADVTDALAVIRAAGLDAVWDAAVKLATFQRRPNAAWYYEREELIDALARAVESSSEKESHDANL